MNSRAWMIRILAALLAIGIGLSLAEAYRTCDWRGALTNLGPELIGAVVTYALFEVFIGQRQHAEAEKERLIQEMGSSVHDVAIAAAEKLRKRGSLYDGSLHGADLVGADLQDAILQKADLRGANLMGAKLRGANLWEAGLQRASLGWTSLQGAILVRADLQGAGLMRASLQGAALGSARLQGAILWEADLRHVALIGTRFSEETILPDGASWAPDTDMARFTDPEHPDFWRLDDPHSPAY